MVVPGCAASKAFLKGSVTSLENDVSTVTLPVGACACTALANHSDEAVASMVKSIANTSRGLAVEGISNSIGRYIAINTTDFAAILTTITDYSIPLEHRLPLGIQPGNAWLAMGPRSRLLEQRRGPAQQRIGAAPADELDRHRQAVRMEPARQRHRRIA